MVHIMHIFLMFQSTNTISKFNIVFVLLSPTKKNSKSQKSLIRIIIFLHILFSFAIKIQRTKLFCIMLKFFFNKFYAMLIFISQCSIPIRFDLHVSIKIMPYGFHSSCCFFFLKYHASLDLDLPNVFLFGCKMLLDLTHWSPL